MQYQEHPGLTGELTTGIWRTTLLTQDKKKNKKLNSFYTRLPGPP